jgi:adenosylmethionine-8-amino-7-oxononanoate aminotransferase
MSSVFRRSPGAALHSVVRRGVWLWDTQGHRSLDGCSGAVVVSVGHGRAEVVDAMARQGRNIAYVHNGEFTSQALEEFGARLAAVYTQVCLAFGHDETTQAVTERLIADSTVWMSRSRWRGS